MPIKENDLIIPSLKIIYENKGYLPHFKSIKLIKKANLLLNFTYNSTSNDKMIPGKILEYIATCGRVLAFE